MSIEISEKFLKYLSVFGLFIASGAFAENDLNPWDTVKLDLRVFTSIDENGDNYAMFGILHKYTNTLSCSFNVEIPIINENNIVDNKLVSIKNALVFPEAAFDSVFEYPIYLGDTINNNDKVKPGFSKIFAKKAECSGWDTEIPLPKETCDALVSDKDKSHVCRLLYPGQKTFPVLRNNQYIGACEC